MKLNQEFSMVRGGVLVFYAVSALFEVIEFLDLAGAENVALYLGRYMGAAGALILIILGLSELKDRDILSELEGVPGETGWRAAGRLFALYGLIGGGRELYLGNYWSGTLLLCYPAWLGVLRLEWRRRLIASGQLAPAFACYLALWLAAAALIISLVLTLALPDAGPTISLRGEPYRLIPGVTIISVPAVLLGAFLTGGRLRPAKGGAGGIGDADS